jgi:hypothetical protein
LRISLCRRRTEKALIGDRMRGINLLLVARLQACSVKAANEAMVRHPVTL